MCSIENGHLNKSLFIKIAVFVFLVQQIMRVYFVKYLYEALGDATFDRTWCFLTELKT